MDLNASGAYKTINDYYTNYWRNHYEMQYEQVYPKKIHQALNINLSKKPWKKFKGFCNKCGQQGHKGATCPNRSNKTMKKPDGRCWNCGKQGHFQRNCPDLKNRQGRQQANNIFVGEVFLTNSMNTQEDQVNFPKEESYKAILSVRHIGEGYFVFDREDEEDEVNLFADSETDYTTSSEEGLMEADSFNDEEVDNQPETTTTQNYNIFDDDDEELESESGNFENIVDQHENNYLKVDSEPLDMEAEGKANDSEVENKNFQGSNQDEREDENIEDNKEEKENQEKDEEEDLDDDDQQESNVLIENINELDKIQFVCSKCGYEKATHAGCAGCAYIVRMYEKGDHPATRIGVCRKCGHQGPVGHPCRGGCTYEEEVDDDISEDTSFANSLAPEFPELTREDMFVLEQRNYELYEKEKEYELWIN
jgi:hypothetical protein